MKFSLKELEEHSKKRPQGYYNEVLSLSIKINNNEYELSDENFSFLAQKYRTPSLFEITKNLIQATNQAISDPTLRSQEEIEKITKICISCPFLVEDGFRCGVCGCFLKWKARLRSWKCPKGKW